tara:strand:- start:256 stop:1110 length:855 start_codon:yes stop_codon:yes gene_type:complete
MAEKCISCNSDKNIELYQKDSFLGSPVYKCVDCGLMFFYSSDQELEDKCNNYYKKEYWSKFRKKGEQKRAILSFIIHYLRLFKTHPLQQSWHLSLIRKFSQNNNIKRLLEIGCGKGETIRYFSQLGLDVTGIEPDLNNTKKINKMLGKKVVINGLGDKVKIEGKFDVIYMCHVFEHFIRPDKFLKIIKNNLNEEGVIFIEVPNCDNKKVLYNSLNLHPHIYSFTLNSTRKLFENNGYQVLKSGVYSQESKNYIIKLYKMLRRKNNYREDKEMRGEGIYLLAKPL